MGKVIDIGRPGKVDDAVASRMTDIGRFIGSNEEFANATLPQLRLAVLLCNRDPSEVSELVRTLAGDAHTLSELFVSWRDTAEYFSDLARTLETASALVKQALTELGAEPSRW